MRECFVVRLPVNMSGPCAEGVIFVCEYRTLIKHSIKHFSNCQACFLYL